MEIARENPSSWMLFASEKWFCKKVAGTNKLELLIRWMREEKKCEWNEWTSTEAAKHGNVEMVKYRVANECPIDAAWHLESLKYSHGVLTYTKSAAV